VCVCVNFAICKIIWFASFSMLEGGVNVVQRTRSTRSVFVPRGGLGEQRGAGVLRGGNAAEEFLEPT